MLVVRSWLEEFLPDGALAGHTAEELGNVLTSLGLVTEEITETGFDVDGIVVSEIIAVRPHPSADRIQLVDVKTAEKFMDGAETIQICCGAPNVAAGQKVPLATLGTVMPDGMKIAKRPMRGQDSFGMICSGAELGLSQETSGIMVLAADVPVGTELKTVLGSNSDTVFDLDIEGNRPDALSHAGIARDLAAKLGVKFQQLEPKVKEAETLAADVVSVSIAQDSLCKRFGLRVLEQITLGDSPDWMQQRLIAAGMRPINAIVDISNYVMLELGQPTHTYDLDLLPDGVLGVRNASEAEPITTLDAVDRSLSAADVAIVDGTDAVIGIAGVMGGASTEISASTTRVALEAAVWDQMTTAKTVRRLNLRSEASTRFERGVDPLGCERALDRFCELAQQICGATVAQGTVVATGSGYEPVVVSLNTVQVNMYLASSFSDTDVKGYLDSLGYQSKIESVGKLVVDIPSWRPDSSIPEDLIEEIGRLYGYDNIGKSVPKSPNAGSLTQPQKARRRLRDVAVAMGFCEAMPLPFLAPNDLTKAGLGQDAAAIALANPLVVEESILRTDLLPGLLKAISYNQSHRSQVVSLFELGEVFAAAPTGELPIETEMVGFVQSGLGDSGTAAQVATGWLDEFFAALRIDGWRLVNSALPGMHPTRCAEITFRGSTIGRVGEVDPRVLDAYSVTDRVAALFLNTQSLKQALAKSPKAKTVSKFPSAEFDLAFSVADSVPADSVAGNISKAIPKLAEAITLFDVFRSDKDPGRRSLAYRISLRSNDSTLTDSEVAKSRQAAIDAVTSKLDAQLRG